MLAHAIVLAPLRPPPRAVRRRACELRLTVARLAVVFLSPLSTAVAGTLVMTNYQLFFTNYKNTRLVRGRQRAGACALTPSRWLAAGRTRARGWTIWPFRLPPSTAWRCKSCAGSCRRRRARRCPAATLCRPLTPPGPTAAGSGRRRASRSGDQPQLLAVHLQQGQPRHSVRAALAGGRTDGRADQAASATGSPSVTRASQPTSAWSSTCSRRTTTT